MKEAISLFVIGFIVALGKFCVSKEIFSWRTIIGRGILGGALGLISYPITWIISHWIPLPPGWELHIMIGLSCAMAAAGTEILERVLDGIIYKFTGSPPVTTTVTTQIEDKAP